MVSGARGVACVGVLGPAGRRRVGAITASSVVYQTGNNVIDLDKNGIISKEEFVTSDKDGDGQLTIKEADVDAQLISTSSSTSCKEVDVDDFSVVYRMEGDDVVSSIEFDGAPRLGFLRCCNCVGPVCPMAAINLWMALWPCCE